MSVATQREAGLFVGGETVEGSESRELFEPATGEPLATVQLAGEADIDRAVDAARAAQDGDWFGGYKQSGFGRERALETLDLYLETKSVIVNTGSKPLNPFGL